MPVINETFQVYFKAWNTVTNAPESGDSANISMFASKGGAAGVAISDTISEITNQPGTYTFLATTSEMNDDSTSFDGTSSTSDVVIYPAYIETQNVVADHFNAIVNLFMNAGSFGKLMNDLAGVLPLTTIATQGDVLALSNNTKARITVADPIQIPASGDILFPIDFYFYDSAGAGVLTDPDNNEIAIQIRAINQAIFRTALFDDEGGTTPATASGTFTGFFELNRLGQGRYQTFYKLPSTELQDQWNLKFQLEEGSVLLEYSTNIGIVVNVASIELNDSVNNRGIMARSFKSEDVSGTADVPGSNYNDLKTDLDAIVTKLPVTGIMSNLQTTTTIGTSTTLAGALELAAAQVHNRMRKDFPAAGDVTLFKDDSTTVLAETNVTVTERTKTL